MALIFPSSPFIGQTYQSGSSNTYEWTGAYWKIKNITSAQFVPNSRYNIDSASFAQRIITATNEGQFAITGSNTFYGNQILSGSSDVVLNVRGASDLPWAIVMANDTYALDNGYPGQFQFGAFVYNDGRSALGTEIDRPLEFYTNANYANPNLILSSSGNKINNLTVTNDVIVGEYLILSGSSQIRVPYATSNALFGMFDGSQILGPYYQMFGNQYGDLVQRGSVEFVFDSRNGGESGFNLAEFDGNTFHRKLRVKPAYTEILSDTVLSGSFKVSGSIIPATGDGTYTSSFSLGSATNAWKDLYISHGSIIFVDAVTQETSSFSIAKSPELGNNTVQYTAAITASQYIGDGAGLFNLPSQTWWNSNKNFKVRNNEFFTFPDNYVLENSTLYVEGPEYMDWVSVTTNAGIGPAKGYIQKISNNNYLISGPDNSGGEEWLYIKRFFSEETTLTIPYDWHNRDAGEDWPIYELTTTEPSGSIDFTSRLDNNNAHAEQGTWTIAVPSNCWFSIGVYSTDSCCNSGSLYITLPNLTSTPKDTLSFISGSNPIKKEGKIFIGGNLILKDSVITNDGQINVAGEVILIGDSQIIGTGTTI